MNLKNASCSLSNCIFEDCGHPEMSGGAILAQSYYTLSGCQFTDCIAKIGGGIYAENIYNISHCHFIRCKSTGYQSTPLEPHDGGGMFVYETSGMEGQGCLFEESNVRLNYVNNISEQYFSGTLVDSYLSLKGKIRNSSNVTVKNKKIKDAGVINNISLTRESWWGR